MIVGSELTFTEFKLATHFTPCAILGSYQTILNVSSLIHEIRIMTYLIMKMSGTEE